MANWKENEARGPRDSAVRHSRLPPPSRRNHAVALQKQSKVISQAAVNGIFEGERQNLWTDFPLSDATGERILIQTSDAAWNGGCRGSLPRWRCRQHSSPL